MNYISAFFILLLALGLAGCSDSNQTNDDHSHKAPAKEVHSEHTDAANHSHEGDDHDHAHGDHAHSAPETEAFYGEDATSEEPGGNEEAESVSEAASQENDHNHDHTHGDHEHDHQQ